MTIIEKTCFECHDESTSKGGLNLAQLTWDPKVLGNRRRWVLVHDRIATGVMPPDSKELAENKRRELMEQLGDALHEADYAEVAKEGRGPMRRLTRREYEQNLRDILKLPRLDIRDMLPADREKHHCNKVADALDVSRVQLASYLDAADAALRHAVATGIKPREAVQHRFFATQMFQEAQTFGGREAMFYAKESRMVALTAGDLGKTSSFCRDHHCQNLSMPVKILAAGHRHPAKNQAAGLRSM